MQRALNAVSAQWLRKFDAGAEKTRRLVCRKDPNYSDGALKQILKDSGFAVDFKMTETMRETHYAVIAEQVGLIEEHHEPRRNARANAGDAPGPEGWRLAYPEQAARIARWVTSRAVLIARDQNAKATSVITKVRQREIGVTTAIWKHSHAGKVPRPHVAADGQEYGC